MDEHPRGAFTRLTERSQMQVDTVDLGERMSKRSPHRSLRLHLSTP